MAARLGGDEFAILLLDEPELGAAVTIASADHRRVRGHVPDPRARTSRSRPASGSPPASRPATRPTTCCATRTSRCTRPSRRARTGSRCSSRRCTRRSSPGTRCRPSSRTRSEGEIDVFYQPSCRSRPAHVRRRGARPLAPPDPRLRGARRVHPAGRGERRDPRARPGRAVRGLPGGGAVALGAPARAISLTVNLSAAQLAQETFVDDCRTSSGRPASRPRGWSLEMTETAMFTRHPDDHRAPRRAARPGRPDRRRRLRDRLLVARLPAPVPGRHPQDRARVRRAGGERPRRLGVRRRDRRARAHRSACGSSPRGSRSRTSSSSCGAGLRVRPGLPVREADAAARRSAERARGPAPSAVVPGRGGRSRSRRPGQPSPR